MDNIVCFTCGMAVCYLMFRALKILAVALLLVPFSSQAQFETNNPVNWDPTNGTVQFLGGAVHGVTEGLGAFWLGFGLMLAFCLFGWCLRLVFKIGGHGGGEM